VKNLLKIKIGRGDFCLFFFIIKGIFKKTAWR
jgi:hypothetical protein